MKRDFSAPILDLDGEPISLGLTPQAITRALDTVIADIPAEVVARLKVAIEKETGKPLTLGSVVVQALMAPHKGEEDLGGDERIARMELARKVNKGGTIEISAADRDRIKPLVKRLFQGPLVYVTASELLEQDPQVGLA